MYVYCVYLALLQIPNQLPNCLKEQKQASFSSFMMVSSVKSKLILLPFLIVAQHELGTRKAISWSETVYNKDLSSQCYLSAEIEPVHDKYSNYVIKSNIIANKQIF